MEINNRKKKEDEEEEEEEEDRMATREISELIYCWLVVGCWLVSGNSFVHC